MTASRPSYEGQWYDTFVVPTGEVESRMYELFSDLKGKSKIDANFSGMGQVTADGFVGVKALRAHVVGAVDATVEAVIRRLYLRLWHNADLVFEGPLVLAVSNVIGDVPWLIRRGICYRYFDTIRCTVEQQPMTLDDVKVVGIAAPREIPVKVILCGLYYDETHRWLSLRSLRKGGTP